MSDATDSQLSEFVRRSAPRLPKSLPVLKLKGDASNRSYYRVGADLSYVVMVMPREGPVSEEATKGGRPKELPFVNVHRYLERLGVRVPHIHFYDEAAGLMLLEDLGDETFERAQLKGDQERWYGKAVDLLARMRALTDRSHDPSCLAFGRAFDEDLYDWELHHFREYLLEARCQAKLTAAERRFLDQTFRDIARRLAAEPRGFTHRDYQSRNLMVMSDELVVIDFQDALQGPPQYDLVALLRDSYVVLPPALIDHMVERYLGAYAAAGGPRLDPAAFRRTFDLLTVQRKLKDSGRFEFISRVKGNPGFLPHVPASLGYVKEAFSRLPELQELRGLLARFVPELS